MDNKKIKLKIGILQCGRIPDELVGKYDDYDVMFANLLGSEDFSYQTWAVLDNELPDSVGLADGWLITGSRHGVYEDHQWIPPLENHIRETYAAGIPLVGVCFGHQIIAQALGGIVTKFDGGWSVGHVNYDIESLPDGAVYKEAALGVHAYHQDQIITLPADARSFGSTPFCQYAFVRYTGAAMSVQPHPEFDDDFISALLETRGKSLPPAVFNAAKKSIGKPLSSQTIAHNIRQFFLQHGSKKIHSASNNKPPNS